MYFNTFFASLLARFSSGVSIAFSSSFSFLQGKWTLLSAVCSHQIESQHSHICRISASPQHYKSTSIKDMSKAGIPPSVALYANPESEDYTLLYKRQWNTRCRWAFVQKHDIFKREWKDHCCYGALQNKSCLSQQKKYLNGMVWNFIDVYIHL